MNLQRVFGQDREGVWHVATATYPGSMQTECGEALFAICFYAGQPEDIPGLRPTRCGACMPAETLTTENHQ